MRNNGSRIIKLKKADLIERIKENKEKHIIGYEKAVTFYKKEAAEQLEKLMKLNTEGDLSLSLNLTTPVNNAENYDKISAMFEWEIESEIELTQEEFNEYVLDDTSYARNAMFSNTMYSAKFGG